MWGHVGSGATVNDNGDEVVGEAGVMGMHASRVAGGKYNSSSDRRVTSRIRVI